MPLNASRFKKCLSSLFVIVGFFVVSSPVSAVDYQWRTVGTRHFSHGENTYDAPLAIGPDNELYTAFANANDGFKPSVMKFDGTTWSYVGEADFVSNDTEDLSIVVDATGTPYLAYVDLSLSRRPTVKKFDGTNWVTVGTRGFSTSSVDNPVLGISPDGTPYVVFIDTSNNSAPTIMKWNGSSWVMVGSAYTDATGGAPTIKFNSAGTPYVSFSDTSFGWPHVIKFNGTIWEEVGSLTGINLLADATLTISPTGTLYLAIAELADYHPRIYTFDGADWNQLGDGFAVSSTGRFGVGVSPAGKPYVSFADNNTSRASVITVGAAGLEAVGSLAFTSSTQNSFLSLVVNEYGAPIGVYTDNTGGEIHKLTAMAFVSAPGAVQNTQAQRDDFKVNLSWSVPADSGGFETLGYRIERESPTSGFVILVDNMSASVRSYLDTGLQPSTLYNYRVSAINLIGVGDGGSASVTTPNVSAVPLVVPTGVGNSAPSFTINGGATTTNNPEINFDFKVNPQTVRGYVASLDPNFTNAFIMPLNTPTFTLPAIPGTYTMYVKYYSVSGLYSPVLQRTIIYTNSSVRPETIKQIQFTRTLKIGSVGSDVKALQIFLNTHGFVVAKQGPGSPGNETTVFGSATARAVSAFQEAHVAVILKPAGFKKGTGIFGVNTMRLVNEMH